MADLVTPQAESISQAALQAMLTPETPNPVAQTGNLQTGQVVGVDGEAQLSPLTVADALAQPIQQQANSVPLDASTVTRAPSGMSLEAQAVMQALLLPAPAEEEPLVAPRPVPRNEASQTPKSEVELVAVPQAQRQQLPPPPPDFAPPAVDSRTLVPDAQAQGPKVVIMDNAKVFCDFLFQAASEGNRLNQEGVPDMEAQMQAALKSGQFKITYHPEHQTPAFENAPVLSARDRAVKIKSAQNPRDSGTVRALTRQNSTVGTTVSFTQARTSVRRDEPEAATSGQQPESRGFGRTSERSPAVPVNGTERRTFGRVSESSPAVPVNGTERRTFGKAPSEDSRELPLAAPTQRTFARDGVGSQ